MTSTYTAEMNQKQVKNSVIEKENKQAKKELPEPCKK
jgi:hypothetical protein